MTRILLIGAGGQVGFELRRTLSPLGLLTALDRRDVDLANADALRACVRAERYDLIVNAAAFTAVDRAEQEPEVARAINAEAPAILAEAAVRAQAVLVHFSTDYVFDGRARRPYVEEDVPNPLGVYGRTKLEGDRAIEASGADHLIFRTSWVYGNRGRNFLLTILRLARERPELKVVDDQLGAPTWSRMIAEATAAVLAQCRFGARRIGRDMAEVGGLYNLAAGGQTSWAGFAASIVERAGASPGAPRPRVSPIPTSEYPLPAARPAYSVLSQEKLDRVFGVRLPEWAQSLEDCFTERASGLA